MSSLIRPPCSALLKCRGDTRPEDYALCYFRLGQVLAVKACDNDAEAMFIDCRMSVNEANVLLVVSLFLMICFLSMILQ